MSHHFLPTLVSVPRRIASLFRLGLLSAVIAAAPAVVSAASSSVVIAEVYESGSKTNASYYRDYVVLKNVSGSTVSLSGWSFQHYKASTATWNVLNLSGSISAG
jgi:uncharacterized protein